jgi:CTP:molybdopterin cytidylyltransferase MocA
VSADVAAVVLAAGAGRRFGAPKQVARLDGRPLLEHVVARALAVPAVHPVLVVLGAYEREVRRAVDFGGAEVVRCAEWAEGQSASLRAGVAAAGDVDGVAVLLGDMPFVTDVVIAGAVDRLTGDCDAVRTLHRGQPSHPVVLGRRALGAVPALRGDTGARELLGSLRVEEWEAGHLFDATDIDTPAGLRAASSRPPARRPA